MQQFIERLANWFISDKVRDDVNIYTRAQMMVSGVIISWMVVIPVLGLLELIFIGFPNTQKYAAYITLGTSFNWFIALLTLRLFNNFNLCVHILVGTGLAGIAFAVLVTGGINSPVLVAIVVPPVLAAIFSTKKTAFAWCIICAFTCLSLLLIKQAGITAINIIPASALDSLYSIFNALACFLVVGFLYIYEEINNQFQNLLQHEKNHFSDLAHHDNLTGLANRLHFDSTMSKALPNADESETLVGLIYIDLDDFKPINDTYGHETGDQVLKIASQRISRCVRMADTVSRLGGDEFAVILESINTRERMETIAEKIETNMARSMEVYGQTLQVSASIGVSMYPDDARNVRELVESADSNMYTRKRRKKSFQSENLTQNVNQ